MPTDPSNFDWAVLIAAGIAAIVSAISLFYSYQSSKKTTFINVVTSARIKWMSELRDSVSRLTSLTYHWSITSGIDVQENQRILKEIDQMRMLILLLLNPNEPKHKTIIDLVDSISNNTDRSKLSLLQVIINTIVSTTQTLLKETWEEVKREAREGELAEKKVINWWLPDNVRKAIYGEKE